MNKIKLFVVNHKLVSTLILVVLIGGGYWWYHSVQAAKVTTSYVTQPVTKGTLSVSVSGTGQVSPTNSLEFKPQASGTVISVNVVEGQQVKTGDVLATLDQRDADVQVNQARASLAQAQSSYDKLVGPSSATTIKNARTALAQAQKKLAQLLDSDKTNTSEEQAIVAAQSTLSDNQRDDQSTINQKISDTLSSLQDKVLTIASSLDAINKILNDSNIQPTLGIQNFSALAQAKTYNDQAKSLFLTAQAKVSVATLSNYSSITDAALSMNQALSKTTDASNEMYIVLQATIPSGTITQSQIDSYKSTMSSQASSLTTAVTAIQNTEQAVTDAQNTLISDIRKDQQALNSANLSYQSAIDTARNNITSAQTQLDTDLANVDQAELSSAQAQINSAEAQLQSAENGLNNTILKAPFDGQVAVVDIKPGDQAGSTTAAFTLITKQKVAKITLNETDVAKVAIGQKATMTFDALDGVTEAGTVIQVDLVGTLTQNVVSYGMQILFDSDNASIKPGMSVSASVITNVKQDVLIVPSTAVKTQNDGSSYVQILNNGVPENHVVTVGISNDSATEVSGDIAEGDAVITQTVTSTTAAKPATTGSLFNLGGGGGNRGFGGGGGGTGGGGGAGVRTGTGG